LIDFSIPPEFLKTAHVILKDIPLDFILLRPSLKVCAARAANRAEGKIAQYSAEFYALFGGMERHAIEDDSADAATLARRIGQGLNNGVFRTSVPT
jgi:hypothetical protein